MIWTSVLPYNMHSMIDKTFKEEHAGKIIASWGRDTLHLGPRAYKEKVQVYKRLEWIWADNSIQAQYPKDAASGLGVPAEWQKWGQHNTLLVDDSTDKAVTEPYNHIHIPEYMGPKARGPLDENQANVLGQVRTVIEQASYSANVSHFFFRNPGVMSLGEDPPAKTRLNSD